MGRDDFMRFGMSEETTHRLWDNDEDQIWDYYEYVLEETMRVNLKESE